MNEALQGATRRSPDGENEERRWIFLNKCNYAILCLDFYFDIEQTIWSSKSAINQLFIQ